MKILLFGDIASGKTTISVKIKYKYPSFEIVAIDDFRRKFGDYTMKGENITLENFLKQIKKDKNQIIEASGLGKLGTDIYNIISGFREEILVVILHIPLNIINERIENRTWDIPFPGKQKKLDEIIFTVNTSIKSGKITSLWAGYPKTVILKTANNNIKQQTFIINTISNFININAK